MTWSASEPAVRVLGSVSVEVDGRPVPVGGPLPRRLLAVLLANRGAVLGVDRLVEVLWGDDPPEAATSSLQTYVSRLRRLLPPSVRLETAAPGYRLRLDPGAADLERFEAALGEALACLADRPEAALAGLEEALSFWRGDAFAEFAGEWWAQGEAARLEELRLHAREAHAEALLGLGRSEAAVSEARAVTADHPNRERAWRTLVLGLHRCGRQRDALQAAGEYRARLRDESGLDPSKDFADLEHAVAVDGPSEPARLGNVTQPVTSLVGRHDELDPLVGEVTQRRLVTLTGVGGVGKTRLAAELAWSLGDKFPDGVWAVELAPVASPDAVAHAVAGTLSIRSQEGMSVAESVADALRGRRSLLVLDNCEHVLDAVGELAVLVMTSCPTVALLTTSREPIGVPGEHVWAVPPLPPTAGGVELFCARAAAADAAFTPSEADLAAIAEVCERLDGLPLAIELAAARVRSMTLVDLTEALHDRFRLLRGGRRSGPERHQTLQATVQWSYQLLNEEERLLFDRLAVFAGGFDVAAVEAVCSDDRVDRVDVGDLLGALVDKSMVVADRRGTHARYTLLETLRQYGEERLDERREMDVLRDRHLAYFSDLARRADRQAKGAGYFEGVGVLEVEWDNLRAGLDRAVRSFDATRGSELVERLLQFAVWQQRHELGEWAERVIELDGAGPGAYAAAAMFSTLRGDQQRALELSGRGMAAATVATPGKRLCAEMNARALWFSGQLAQGWAAAQRWGDMFDPAEEPFEAAWAALCVSSFAVAADPPTAAGYVARARQIAAPLGNAALETHIVWATGLVETNAGRYDAARDLFRQALERAVQTGDLYFEGWTTRSIALLAASTNAADAGSALRHALARLYATRNWMNVWGVVEALSLYWYSSDRMEPAAVLLGYLEAHDYRHAGGGGRSGSFVERRQLAIAALLELPGAEAWMAHGAELGRDELVTYALDQLASSDDA